MKIAMMICGGLIVAASAFMAYRSCKKIPRNLGGYYGPGYIALGAVGIAAGIALIAAGVLAW